jgi:hypothetical protein
MSASGVYSVGLMLDIKCLQSSPPYEQMVRTDISKRTDTPYHRMSNKVNLSALCIVPETLMHSGSTLLYRASPSPPFSLTNQRCERAGLRRHLCNNDLRANFLPQNLKDIRPVVYLNPWPTRESTDIKSIKAYPIISELSVSSQTGRMG